MSITVAAIPRSRSIIIVSTKDDMGNVDDVTELFTSHIKRIYLNPVTLARFKDPLWELHFENNWFRFSDREKCMSFLYEVNNAIGDALENNICGKKNLI